MRHFFDLALLPAGHKDFSHLEHEEIKRNMTSMLKMSSELKLKGVCFLFSFSKVSEAKEIRKMVEECIKNCGVNVKTWIGVLIVASNEREMRRKVDKLKKSVDIVAVQGGDIVINRAACSNPWVDMLLDPHSGRKDSGMDHVMAKFAADFKVGIACSFRQLLDTGSKRRAHILQHIRNNITLCEKYGARFLVVSGATDRFEMRDGRALASMATVLRVRQDRALAFVSENPEKIIELAATRRDPNLMMPGVRIIRRGGEKDGEA